MKPVDPDVLVGRDPAWEEAWEENLTREERRRVKRAVMRGVRIDDSDLIPYVSGLLARSERGLRWRMVVNAGTFVLWLSIGIAFKSHFARWLALPFAFVFLVAGTAGFVIQRRCFARAERLNLWDPATQDR